MEDTAMDQRVELYKLAQGPHVFVPNSHGVEHVCAKPWCYRYKDDPMHIKEEVPMNRPMIRTTHTVVTMEVPEGWYDWFKAKLEEAGYTHCFNGDMIDMTGIALTRRVDMWCTDCKETHGKERLTLTQLNCHMHGEMKSVVDSTTHATWEPNRTKSSDQRGIEADGIHPFSQWMRLWLDDMLVIDAVALWFSRDGDGKISTVHPLAGDKRYGYSKVEQLIVTINIGLRRQMFQLNYYTDGNMPEAKLEATLKLIRAYLEESE
jgi:hypothetical protein